MDIKVKRVWAASGIRPVRIVSGERERTVMFGALGIDGMQLFRQYGSFNGKNFLDFLKKVHRKFGKMYLFMDRAWQHTKTSSVKEYIRRNRKTLRVRWIPVASPEFNVTEECWRQAEKDLGRLPIFPISIGDLREFLARYFRTRRFWLDVRRFLLTEKCK